MLNNSVDNLEAKTEFKLLDMGSIREMEVSKMNSKKICILCGNDCEVDRDEMMGGGSTIYPCNDCGTYIVSDLFPVEQPKIRSMMYYYLVHKDQDDHDNSVIRFVLANTSSSQNNKEYRYIDKAMLETMWPKTLNERVDMVMMNLSRKIQCWSDVFILPMGYKDTEVMDSFILRSSVIFICETFSPQLIDRKNLQYATESIQSLIKEMEGTLDILQEYGYLKIMGIRDMYSFTVNGWKRLGELQAKNKEIPQAFIAMWFNAEMSTARETICRAIEDSGYNHMIIDDKEHNKQIVPEIFYEIKRSKFIVADLTGHRNGVYYEAGYAEALGKEVILTCKKDAFDEIHFDVAQKSTIVWANEDDLYEKLLRRIEVTVGTRDK